MKIFEKKLQNLEKNQKKVKEIRKNGKCAILIYGKLFWREKRSSENTPQIFSGVSEESNFVFQFCEVSFQRKLNFDVENKNFKIGNSGQK